MGFIVGRKGDQKFPITDKSVSGVHLKLTELQDGKILVEDLGSTNGTYIEGVRITKMIVDRNTIVQMGPSYTFYIRDVLPEVFPQGTLIGNRENTVETGSNIEIVQSFNELESIWNKYQRDKINLQKSNASKNFLRMLPMFVLGIVGYFITLLPELSYYRLPITIACIVIGIIITWVSYKSTTNFPEQMEKLNQQFQIDYVCPKCKQFLGFTPFKALKNKGVCTVCKTKWTKV